MDFLYGLGQVICIIGLLYGAYLSITYAGPAGPSDGEAAATTPRAQSNTAYDALTSHVWTATRAPLQSRRD
jgi:hypothetical protein